MTLYNKNYKVFKINLNMMYTNTLVEDYLKKINYYYLYKWL